MTNRVAHQFTEALADVGGRGERQVERVLEAPTEAFRAEVIDLGFEVLGRAYSIVQFVIGDKALSASVSEDPLAEILLVTDFRYPEVPRGAPRI